MFRFKSLQSTVFSQDVSWRADSFTMRLVAWAASFLKDPLVSPRLKVVFEQVSWLPLS